MAKKNFREIISDIRKKNFNPVYILTGPEAYYIDKIVENIEKYAIDDADRDFNCNIFYGNDSTPEYVVAAAQQFPVMAERKLVILKEAQTIQPNRSQLDKLAPYISRPNQTTIFVVACKGEALKATSPMLKAAKESDAVVFTSEEPKAYELPVLVKDYCSDRKIQIEEKAVQMLCESIGGPLSKLFGEVNKLIGITGGARITAGDVERNIGFSKDFNNFELTDAISDRNYAKAMKIVTYFEANRKANPTVVTSGMLFKHFMNILTVHYLADKSDSNILKECGFKSNFQVKRLKAALKNYSAMQAVNAIHYIREFDCKSKGIGSAQNEFALLKELIFKIFT